MNIIPMNLFSEFERSNRERFKSSRTGSVLKIDAGDNIRICCIDLLTLRAINDSFSRRIKFVGDLIIRAGVFREGYSFQWIWEKEFISAKVEDVNFDIDLSEFENGNLEVFVYANKDTSIFVDYIELQPINNIDKSKLLYEFTSPKFDLCSEIELYYHIEHDGYFSYSQNRIFLKKDSKVDFATYFNSLSAEKWFKYTNVRNIGLWLDLEGKCEIEIEHVTTRGVEYLNKYYINAEKRTNHVIDLQMPQTGILGFVVRANSEAIIYGGGYLSYEQKVKEIKLGIGITTFKRENAVIKSSTRLAHAIAENTQYKDKISVTVVDNGQTLTSEQLPGVKLITNRNLGGSGGFMRSLISYQEQGNYTHCLFMDDDASCEVSSIFRAVAFVEHCAEPSISISGAMLSENIKFIQWENGAWFDKSCHPMHCNLDLREKGNLVENETNLAPMRTYGAWWFFLFPLSCVKSYSFPFFVRGDDVEFSYQNEFEIVRMNGISTWQEDFKIKESPMTLYLDIRSHILHHMLIKDIDNSPKTIIDMVWTFFARFNWAYQYDTAESILQAFEDVLKGPKFWEENLEMTEIRKRFKERFKNEQPKELRKEWRELPIADRNLKTGFMPKTLREISLNGHLLPKFMCNKVLQRLDKYEIPFINRMYLRNTVLIINRISNTEFVLERNPKRFFKNIFKFIKLKRKFKSNYNKIRSMYIDYYQQNYSDSKKWNEFFKYFK